MKIVNHATGFDGSIIKVGDKVISKLGILATVVKIHHQGRDGTIITTDIGPDPDFPHHFSGAAKRTYRLAIQPNRR